MMRPQRVNQAARGQRFHSPVLAALSLLSTAYIVNRLWQGQNEVRDLVRNVLKRWRSFDACGCCRYAAHDDISRNSFITSQHQRIEELQLGPAGLSDSTEGEGCSTLHYSTRAAAVDEGAVFQGASDVVDDLVLGVRDGALAGGIDLLDSGIVTGWACQAPGQGSAGSSVEVRAYIDGALAASARSNESLAAHTAAVHACASASQDGPLPVGFRVRLPPLSIGVHELRIFATTLEGSTHYELDASPMNFRESSIVPDAEEALRRKDAIILFRNAQLSQLWAETKIRKPWPDSFGNGPVLGSFKDGVNSTKGDRRLLMAVAVNTALGSITKRNILRQTWVPNVSSTGEDGAGVVVRFVVGRSEQAGDPAIKQIAAEVKEFGDILRLDVADASEDLTSRALVILAALTQEFDADFYIKVDDDVALNVNALSFYLSQRRGQGNHYMGCMKSGPVVTDGSSKWFESESWRFGDALSTNGINYPRHASGKFYGLSRSVTRYIVQNSEVLHRYSNEDVSFGTWLLGLDIVYEDERRFCCDSEAACREQSTTDRRCIGYYEGGCNGICHPERRLESIFHSCMENR